MIMSYFIAIATNKPNCNDEFFISAWFHGPVKVQLRVANVVFIALTLVNDQ